MKYLKISVLLIIIITSFIIFMAPHNKYVDERINNNYPKLLDNQHIIVEISGRETVELIKKKKDFVIMMGFSPCPWCQNLMPYLNEVGKNEGLKQIYYLDILDMRNNINSVDRKYYNYLYDLCKEQGGLDLDNDRISAPTTFVIKNGNIVAYHLGTVDSHVFKDGHLPALNQEQINELKTILTRLFQKIK